MIAERGAVALGPIRWALAHSISVARSPAGRNLNGAGSAFAIWRRSSAFVGRIRPTDAGREVVELGERRRVEGPRDDTRDAERGEARRASRPRPCR